MRASTSQRLTNGITPILVSKISVHMDKIQFSFNNEYNQLKFSRCETFELMALKFYENKTLQLLILTERLLLLK